jgi:hypothetical protein
MSRIAALRCVWSLLFCVGAAAPLCLGAATAAETWTAGGLTFSDAPGGVRLLAASGSGTRADPIVLVEEIIGSGPAVLEIHNGRTGDLDVSPALGFLTLSVVRSSSIAAHGAGPAFDLVLRPDRISRASMPTGCRSTSRRPCSGRQSRPVRADCRRMSR